MRQNKISIFFLNGVDMVKLRYFEKATKFGKNLPLVLTLDIYSVVGDFFQIFMAFSENLNFNRQGDFFHVKMQMGRKNNECQELISTHCSHQLNDHTKFWTSVDLPCHNRTVSEND